MKSLIWPIALIGLPVVGGIVCLILPSRARKAIRQIALVISCICLALSAVLFLNKPVEWETGLGLSLRLDDLSGFIILASAFFTVLIVLYSFRFMEGRPNLKQYYGYILWTLGASCGALLADNIWWLLIFWGVLAFTLYILIGLGGPKASGAAKKTFVIVGGSDALMLLGLVIIWIIAGTASMSAISILPTGGAAITAFVCIALAAFAKAGAMPLHTWIPDSAEPAPLPIVAYLPASLDKLLGIYLLFRISTEVFVITPNSALSVFLLFIGAITVIAAVMMALIQHDLKKLLSYHAVSQVGYMVLGIGTGIPIGIAGGIFHMLNHAIYKCCLFLTGGAVERQAGTTDLDKLGGLARILPITFICCLTAALSISGIPPFNGFVSKWMVYQGIIEAGKAGEGIAARLWIVWLLAAMFGSALTLASFMKLIHAAFLGQPSPTTEKAKKKGEVPWTMWLPMAVLALLCVIFGVFAYAIPLKWFILPAVPGSVFIGLWSPGIATVMIIIGIGLGALIYLAGKVKGFRVDESYIGGETLPSDNRISGVDFYNTIKELDGLKWFYMKAGEKYFDVYDQGRRLVFSMTRCLSRMHTGVLPAYLAWCLIGMIILLFVLVKS